MIPSPIPTPAPTRDTAALQAFLPTSVVSNDYGTDAEAYCADYYDLRANEIDEAVFTQIVIEKAASLGNDNVEDGIINVEGLCTVVDDDSDGYDDGAGLSVSFSVFAACFRK